MKNHINIILLTFLMSIVCGCVSIPNINAMVAKTSDVIKSYNANLVIRDVKGGAENYQNRYKHVGGDGIHGDIMRNAIAQTFKSAQLFSSVTTSTNEKYSLHAEIIFQDSTFNRVGGGSFTYILINKYIIKDNNKVVYSNKFTSACLKTISDSFGGGARYNMALECAVRKNLTKLISDLNNSSLSL